MSICQRSGASGISTNQIGCGAPKTPAAKAHIQLDKCRNILIVCPEPSVYIVLLCLNN